MPPEIIVVVKLNKIYYFSFVCHLNQSTHSLPPLPSIIYRYMNKRMAIGLLSFGWSLSFVLASVPMFWNNWKTAQVCEFYEILPPWYMAGVITPPFALVWVCLFILYYRIWREASRQVKKLRNTPFAQDRVSDWKSVQVSVLKYSYDGT